MADGLDPNGEERIVERKCLAVDLGDLLLVLGTAEHLEGPVLEHEDLHPVRSYGHHLVTWGTCAALRKAAWSG